MMVDFNRTFFQSKDEEKKKLEVIDRITKDLIEKRGKTTLKRYRGKLYVAEPFDGFIGDCRYCSKYMASGPFVQGGDCQLHKIPCGDGFTCTDNDSEEIKDWKEFKKIINGEIKCKH